MKPFFYLLTLIFLGYAGGLSGQNNLPFRLISGKVVDREQGERLMFVTVGLEGTNTATITNMEGEFSLKIPEGKEQSKIVFSCVGYGNLKMPVHAFKPGKKNIVKLVRARMILPEVLIRQAEGTALMREVIRRIPVNYSEQPEQMVGFYREMIRKNNTYISLAEVVLDIYKAPYNTAGTDMAKIYKGRRNTDITRLDTVMFKYEGGVSTALELDLAKNIDRLFPPDFDQYYDVYCESITVTDTCPNYILSFNQKKEIADPLFKGELIVDSRTLAIIRMDFQMNVEKNEAATAVFLKKKPLGMKVKVQHARYLIQFRQQGEKWYYQNSRADVCFKCKWPKRWFNSAYSLLSEMAVTDRTEEQVSKFPRKERLSPNTVLVEKVADFDDPGFWENYNIIEPEQSLENAIHRLARKLKRVSKKSFSLD